MFPFTPGEAYGRQSSDPGGILPIRDQGKRGSYPEIRGVWEGESLNGHCLDRLNHMDPQGKVLLEVKCLPKWPGDKRKNSLNKGPLPLGNNQ